MKYIKNFDEIDEQSIGGKQNYLLIEKIFSELKEQYIILFNTFEKYYVCLVKDFENEYKLYPVFLKDDIIKKEKDSIFTIKKANKSIDDDIILANDQEKKYYEFILIKNYKTRKFHKLEPEAVKIDLDAYWKKLKEAKQTNKKDERKIYQYNKEEIKATPVFTNTRDYIYNKYKNK